MGTMLEPAEAFPAGEYLRDELEERGWTVTEFAEILARPLQVVSEILNGSGDHSGTVAPPSDELSVVRAAQASIWTCSNVK